MTMTVYIPVYTNHWEVIEEDGNLLRPMSKNTIELGWSVCRYKPGAGYYGNIYNSRRIYTNKKAAWDYIHSNFGLIDEEDYFFDKGWR